MRIPYQRLVISLILFVLCFVPLAACGTTAPEEAAPTTVTDTEDASAAQAAASAPTAAPASAPAAPTSAAPADFASPEAIATRLEAEGATMNFYWPAGGTIKMWITDELIPGYEAYVQETYGVEVTVNILPTGGGDQEFFQRLQAYEQANPAENDFDIDVSRIVPSVDLIQAAQEGWLLPILPDYAEMMVNMDTVNTPGLESFTLAERTYAIPVYQPTISLFYNADQVPEPPQTLDELLAWTAENPRRFTYEDPRAGSGIGSGTMFLLTVMKTFGDPNDPTSYDAGFDYLSELQTHVYPQPTEAAQMLELMKRGDIWLMAFWNDWGLSAARDQNIDFMQNYFLEEGMPVRNTPVAIPSSAAHPTAALLFVDYTLSDEVQRELALLTQQIPASTSTAVWDELPDDTFGYNFEYIQERTFAAFNSNENLLGLQIMVDGFTAEVLDK
jgi:putative spermidine/putrescine transport system substrate-binding protein